MVTAFIRSAAIMTASRALHLTVLALISVVAELEPGRHSSAVRKIAAEAALATPSQSCILKAHSIRRLTKLP
jgi:hypothetical protein